MSIGTRTKRSRAPAFWQISRKRFQFIVSPDAGPHSRENSLSLAVLLRDHMHLFNNMREVEYSLNEGQILVDSVPRYSTGFPVGIMDTLKILPLEKSFRLVPKGGRPLVPIEIKDSESNVKLCKVLNKRTLRKGIIQLGLHDGRNLLLEKTDLVPKDSCLISLSNQKIIDQVRLAPGSTVLVMRGSLAGGTAEVKKVLPGSFQRNPVVQSSMGERQIELPIDHLMVVGKGGKSLIQIS